MDIGYHFMLNMMLPTMIDHRQHEHDISDISVSHGYGYLNHLFDGLLNDSFLRGIDWTHEYFLPFREGH